MTTVTAPRRTNQKRSPHRGLSLTITVGESLILTFPEGSGIAPVEITPVQSRGTHVVLSTAASRDVNIVRREILTDAQLATIDASIVASRKQAS